jgi:hypothetical protein
MKLAIADPPYLGRASIWYGSTMTKSQLGALHGGTAKVQYKPADYHPEAHLWDDIQTHKTLIKQLESDYDGFALCLAHDNLQQLLPLFSVKVKVCIWHKWTLPSGSCISNTYEPVIVRVPDSRRRAIKGATTPDLLTYKKKEGMGFAGRKPKAFTYWLLDLLQYKENDQVDDLFNGSGAIIDALNSYRQELSTRVIHKETKPVGLAQD